MDGTITIPLEYTKIQVYSCKDECDITTTFHELQKKITIPCGKFITNMKIFFDCDEFSEDELEHFLEESYIYFGFKVKPNIESNIPIWHQEHGDITSSKLKIKNILFINDIFFNKKYYECTNIPLCFLDTLSDIICEINLIRVKCWNYAKIKNIYFQYEICDSIEQKNHLYFTDTFNVYECAFLIIYDISKLLEEEINKIVIFGSINSDMECEKTIYPNVIKEFSFRKYKYVSSSMYNDTDLINDLSKLQYLDFDIKKYKNDRSDSRVCNCTCCIVDVIKKDT